MPTKPRVITQSGLNVMVDGKIAGQYKTAEEAQAAYREYLSNPRNVAGDTSGSTYRDVTFGTQPTTSSVTQPATKTQTAQSLTSLIDQNPALRDHFGQGGTVQTLSPSLQQLLNEGVNNDLYGSGNVQTTQGTNANSLPVSPTQFPATQTKTIERSQPLTVDATDLINRGITVQEKDIGSTPEGINTAFTQLLSGNFDPNNIASLFSNVSGNNLTGDIFSQLFGPIDSAAKRTELQTAADAQKASTASLFDQQSVATANSFERLIAQKKNQLANFGLSTNEDTFAFGEISRLEQERDRAIQNIQTQKQNALAAIDMGVSNDLDAFLKGQQDLRTQQFNSLKDLADITGFFNGQPTMKFLSQVGDFQEQKAKIDKIYSDIDLDVQRQKNETDETYFKRQTDLLDRALKLNEGQEITMEDGTVIRGLAKVQPNINTIQKVDENGNWVVIGLDENTGEIAYKYDLPGFGKSKSVGSGGGGGGSQALGTKYLNGDQIETFSRWLTQTVGGDGFVNTGTYRDIYGQIASMSGSKAASEFLQVFPPSALLNPQDPTAATFFGTKPSGLKVNGEDTSTGGYDITDLAS